jgi:hypothetical protein
MDRASQTEVNCEILITLIIIISHGDDVHFYRYF